MRIIRTLLLGAGLAACSLSANALPISFDLSGGPNSSVTVDSDCFGFCGIDASLNPLLDSVTGSLNVGESFRFDFFDLSFWGLGLGSGSITASLAFDQPTGAPNAEGTGYGGFGTFFGFISGGYLEWDPVDPITLADGTSFIVDFDDLVGIDTGTVTVGGTISLVSGPVSSVPEPTTLGLLGLGVLVTGFAARRRRAS